MTLRTTLQNQNYDLIDGPVRNHQLLQVWTKRTIDRATLYSPSLSTLFDQPFEPEIIESPSLTIDNNQEEAFDFDTGIGMLENLMQQFKLGKLKLDQHIHGGKSITLSYNMAVSREIALFELEKYLTKIDGRSQIPSLARELERDNLLVISGLILARELKVSIESEGKIDAALAINLNKLAEGKANFTRSSNKCLTMTADQEKVFPIAVKALRIRFQQYKFKKLVLATDNRDFF